MPVLNASHLNDASNCSNTTTNRTMPSVSEIRKQNQYSVKLQVQIFQEENSISSI